MKENSSKKDSLIVSQMLNILSKEYPVISKNLSKKFSNKRIPNKNQRKQLKAIDLFKHHPSIFQRISEIMGTSVDYKNDSPRYAQVDWDDQDFELSALYLGSYSSKYEDSIETQNSEFDSIFN
tara:strand:- start:271 stop:639 length:369 start_codon:yes stop_codon:yes gene_type:complete